MGRKERSKNRKKKLEKIKNTIVINENIDEELVQKFLTSEVDSERVEETFNSLDEHYTFEYNFDISKEEAREFLEKFKKEFNEDRFQQLVQDCKQEVLKSIITPFGLGKYIAIYDKVGGNVDTIHNARNGVYSTDEAKENYENRSDYDPHEYHSHQIYKDTNKTNSQSKESGELKDYMTGNKINRHDKSDLDHVISAKEIHDDPGRVLAGIDGADLANTETNLKATSSTINRSKKANTMNDFIKRIDENSQEMEILKSKDNLSHKEENRLKKLEELQKIDNKKALEADKEARKAYDKEINKTYYTSQEFVKNTVTTGALEGAKMGLQQALGLVFVEFFTALFDEIIDIYKNGFSSGFDDDGFLNVLQERIKNIGVRLSEKWKDFVCAFKDGAISGFISNMVTTLINMFETTKEWLVRIIREGFFSLLKAIKTILFPPDNLSFSDAMHEAKKIAASGLIISLGVIAEVYVDALIKTTGVLEPFADAITAILIGSITGVAISMTVYYMDKKKNDKKLFDSLACDTNKKFNNIEKLLGELKLITLA
jgi:hypothetical protein